jgi:hypothetical protein
MSSDNRLPVPASPATRDYGLRFLDIGDGDLTDQQLGHAIVANYKAGLTAGKEAETRLVTAGMQLIEAKSKVANFEDFVKDHCNGLSRSRAYELIDIASGKIEEVRAKTRARKLRHRQKQADKDAHVRSGTDTRFPPLPLSQEASLDQFENEFVAWLGKLDDETFNRAVSCALRLDNDRNPALDLTASVVQ